METMLQRKGKGELHYKRTLFRFEIGFFKTQQKLQTNF